MHSSLLDYFILQVLCLSSIRLCCLEEKNISNVCLIIFHLFSKKISFCYDIFEKSHQQKRKNAQLSS